MQYRKLTPEQQQTIAAAAVTGGTAAPDHPTRAAWEAEHYAHSVLLDAATDPDVREQHQVAMSELEAALNGLPADPPAPPPADLPPSLDERVAAVEVRLDKAANAAVTGEAAKLRDNLKPVT